MTDEEFEKKWREREIQEAENQRHREKESNTAAWLFLGLPVVCILNEQIGLVCIAVTIAVIAIRAALHDAPRPGKHPRRDPVPAVETEVKQTPLHLPPPWLHYHYDN